MNKAVLFSMAVCVCMFSACVCAEISGDYEYDPNYIDSTCTITKYTGPGGEVNNDCRFDLADFAIMAEGWLTDCHLTPDDPLCCPK